MPWMELKPVDEKLLFVADALRKLCDFAQLCTRYGISRKTGYKWMGRYRIQGLEGLDERSRRPRSQPEQIPYAIRQAIIELRGHPPMEQGPKKIQAQLRMRFADQIAPCRTTIYKILKQSGLIKPRRVRRRTPNNAGILQDATQPNVLWSADFKGQFLTGDGQWCYPLTVMDHSSRYLLGCQALGGTGQQPSRLVFERLFREYGLPQRLRTDNGVPFATVGVGGLSRLSIWWIHLGIKPERIRPGRPQENGRHERMHRTLKKEVAHPAAANAVAQQRRFAGFRTRYNEQRPHEALNQCTPASQYQPSLRPFPQRLPELDYPSHMRSQRVCSSGLIYWLGHCIYVGNVLSQERIGLESTGDGIWDVHFGPLRLGRFDERDAKPGKNYLTLKKCHPCP